MLAFANERQAEEVFIRRSKSSGGDVILFEFSIGLPLTNFESKRKVAQ